MSNYWTVQTSWDRSDLCKIPEPSIGWFYLSKEKQKRFAFPESSLDIACRAEWSEISVEGELMLAGKSKNGYRNPDFSNPSYFSMDEKWYRSGRKIVFIPKHIIDWLSSLKTSGDINYNFWAGDDYRSDDKIDESPTYYFSCERGSSWNGIDISTFSCHFYRFKDQSADFDYCEIKIFISDDRKSPKYLAQFMHSFSAPQEDVDNHAKDINYRWHKEHYKTLAIHNLLNMLSRYVSAFPDVLKTGYPDNYQRGDVKYSGTRAVSFDVPDRLVSRSSKEISAHFRNGHLRTLRSDKYKRNVDGSFRVVFVSPTFVKKGSTDPCYVD